MKLSEYMNDGANYQAQAVLCFLRDFNIEESWNAEHKQYDATINVARWENCREQGYVLSLRTLHIPVKQLNIIFYEHRNSDSICAVKWQQSTLNSPTISTAEFGKIFKDKYDVSFQVSAGEIAEMAVWIKDELNYFWQKHHDHTKNKTIPS